jgi:hypothetical protein
VGWLAPEARKRPSKYILKIMEKIYVQIVVPRKCIKVCSLSDIFGLFYHISLKATVQPLKRVSQENEHGSKVISSD